MSGTKCELFNGLVALFAVVALCSILMPITASVELLLLRLLALALTLAHIHYAVCVIQQMCDHFNINCLSLKRRESETSRQHLLASDNPNKQQPAVQIANSLSFASDLSQGSTTQSIEDEQLLG